jgi:hypothetical protein
VSLGNKQTDHGVGSGTGLSLFLFLSTAHVLSHIARNSLSRGVGLGLGFWALLEPFMRVGRSVTVVWEQ